MIIIRIDGVNYFQSLNKNKTESWPTKPYAAIQSAAYGRPRLTDDRNQEESKDFRGSRRTAASDSLRRSAEGTEDEFRILRNGRSIIQFPRLAPRAGQTDKELERRAQIRGQQNQWGSARSRFAP